MAKQLIGTVNAYGKEIIEASGRAYEFVPDRLINGLPITWKVWEIVPNQYEPKSQKDYDSLTGYAGD